MESFIVSDVDIIVYIMYTKEAKNMVLKMKASEFDKDGLYSDKKGRKNHCLIGDYLEIPFFLDLPLGLARPSMSNDVEEILLKMYVRSDFCIRCNTPLKHELLMFATRSYRMLVLWCCDQVVWTTEGEIKRLRRIHGWKGDSQME